MSLNRTSSGGVRNLRAMFETAGAASPEPRGRSPAESVASNGEARPLSKVRTSFVPVQGSPRKQSPAAHAPNSNSPLAEETMQELGVTEPDDKKIEGSTAEGSLAEGTIEPVSTAIPDETDPLTAPATAELAADADAAREKDTAMVPDGDVPIAQPDKPTTSEEDADTELKPLDPKDVQAVSGGSALPPPTENLIRMGDNPDGDNHTTEEAPPEQLDGAGASVDKPTATPDKPTTSAEKSTAKKPAAISTSKPSATKPLSRNPAPPATVPKTPTTPSHAQKPKLTPSVPSPAAKDATKPLAHRSSRVSLGQPQTTGNDVSKSAVPKPQPKNVPTQRPHHSSPPAKPKPRSPTRPIRLPSHLTAPTASSAAKHDVPPATTTNTSSLNKKPSTLPKERTPATKPAPSSTTTGAIRKQASRASLPNPPPKRPESRSSHTTTTARVDEGFLARMMRPTASSASKTHEKVEVKTPPRRTASVRTTAKKTTQPSGALDKGKKKVTEMADKAKETLESENGTNGEGTVLEQ